MTTFPLTSPGSSVPDSRSRDIGGGVFTCADSDPSHEPRSRGRSLASSAACGQVTDRGSHCPIAGTTRCCRSLCGRRPRRCRLECTRRGKVPDPHGASSVAWRCKPRGSNGRAMTPYQSITGSARLCLSSRDSDLVKAGGRDIVFPRPVEEWIDCSCAFENPFRPMSRLSNNNLEACSNEGTCVP